jgi:hypothetical protein
VVEAFRDPFDKRSKPVFLQHGHQLSLDVEQGSLIAVRQDLRGGLIPGFIDVKDESEL